MKQSVGTVEEMAAFAAEFVGALSPGVEATVIALSGELGAGKTTFAQAAALALGVEETVNSPTFVIEKIYELPEGSAAGGWHRLVHIDAYRLHTAEELRRLGWDELVQDGGNLIIIEWPEHAPGALPVQANQVRIDMGEGNRRTITYGD